MKRQRPDTRSMPRQKTHLRVGDTVEVISGKDRGRTGQIQEILRDETRARVSGLALVTKHQRAGRSRAMQAQTGRIQLPGKIHLSNLMLVCPSCGQRTRPKSEGDTAATRRRVCRKCNATIGRASVEE